MSDEKWWGYHQYAKNAIAMTISREMALDYGLVEPTPEEAAERAEQAREWRLREEQAWRIFDAMVPRLAALTEPATRAVLNLHANNDAEGGPACDECYIGDDRAPWPCDTVKAIAAVHEIEVPDIELWRRP
jgi:hypothetical protein